MVVFLAPPPECAAVLPTVAGVAATVDLGAAVGFFLWKAGSAALASGALESPGARTLYSRALESRNLFCGWRQRQAKRAVSNGGALFKLAW